MIGVNVSTNSCRGCCLFSFGIHMFRGWIHVVRSLLQERVVSFHFPSRRWTVCAGRTHLAAGGFLQRALMISSANHLEKELDHLRKVFCDINHYPPQVTNKIIAEEVEKHQSTKSAQDNITEEVEEPEKIQLNLPYGGEKGQQLMRKLGQNVRKSLKGKVQLRTTYTPCKLGSRFPLKDKTKLIHQHNVSYHITCANKKCKSNYVGQTKRRTLVRTMDHNSKDSKSHVLQHSKKTKHRRVFLPNVKILGSGYRTNFRRVISEALFIKELKPDLNVQKDAYKLKLFNW